MSLSKSHRVLIDAHAIQARVAELGQDISSTYQNSDGLMMIGILKGALYFLADLSRAISLSVKIDLITASSYIGTQSTGNIAILKDLDVDIQGEDVLIVEDIVDTGYTLAALQNCLQKRNPRSLRICSLLDKPDRRIVPVAIDFIGFTIPDHFVIGYGLDHEQAYRNLPYIAILNAT